MHIGQCRYEEVVRLSFTDIQPGTSSMAKSQKRPSVKVSPPNETWSRKMSGAREKRVAYVADMRQQML